MKITDQVPLCKPKHDTKGRPIIKLPWDSSSLKRKRKAKDAKWENFDKFATSENLNLALQKQLEYENSERQAKIKYERKIRHLTYYVFVVCFRKAAINK